MKIEKVMAMVSSGSDVSAPPPHQANGRPHAKPPEAAAEPPPAPEMPRRLELSKAQALGAIALACVAASAVFMAAQETQEATAQGLSLRVEYPQRMRFRDAQRLLVDVTRTASEPCQTASLTIDETYLENFSERRAVPAEAAFGRFDLGALMPGESRRIVLELRGERPWFAAGNATLSCDGERAAAPLRTFIFP
ncbi:hypothetical protein SOCE26_063060 [Sorangium cellulosum]|uniref:Uncharacterized protein n=1 Tax=Sorangium cellulosum TaxID=56 RepID=A0A2L0EZT5_SORCE|nr:hypothetical protein [Sorangium cellulosum]AUX44837.1 hypothetical protein SOCE26_063060 [Sorangium cellulosum]